MIRYNPKGLTTPQIDESRRRHGDNVITPPKDDSAWRLLLEKFRDPIIRILLLAAVLSLIIGFVHKDFTESVGIICAIILATCVGFWFEWDAQRRFRRLNQVNDDIPVKVMREGSIREIPRRDVVTGDVVYIEKLDQEAGDTVKFDQVLAILDGDKATFGTPVVEGASVEGKIVKNGKGKKIRIFKYNAKKAIVSPTPRCRSAPSRPDHDHRDLSYRGQPHREL